MEPLQRGAALFPAAALRTDLGASIHLLVFRIFVSKCCSMCHDTCSQACVH